MAWPPEGSLTDERLAFLAIEPELRALSRPWWLALVKLFTAGGASNGVTVSAGASGALDKARTTSVAQDVRDRRMLDYVVAADVAAQRLNAEERKALRATGELPAWFLGAVQEAKAELRRR
jgi:hypothetical protein